MDRIEQLIMEMDRHIEKRTIDGEYAQELYQELCKVSDEKKRIAMLQMHTRLGRDLIIDIWMYSFMLAVYADEKLLNEFLQLLLEDKVIPWKNLCFLYNQIERIVFVNKNLDKADVLELQWKLLEKIYSLCKAELNKSLHRIPKNERNPKFAIVLTEQFLGEEHGPTKTALDRCWVLKKKLGMEVLCINTAELLSTVGQLPFFCVCKGGYEKDYLLCDKHTWKGVDISYFQCEQNMPDIGVMGVLLDTIQTLKPSVVVSIGGKRLFTGLANEIVPVLVVGTTTSGLVYTLADYQIVGEAFLEDGNKFLKRVGKDEEHLIGGRFTFALKEQSNQLTREELQIPSDAFALAIIGGRLNEEITPLFLEMLESIIEENVIVVVIGNYTEYEEKLADYPKLKKNIRVLGMCSDVLAIIEHCDLYVNPTRRGGGTSAVEAMFKAKPVVSTNYGDVANIVGDDFCCEDYDEMQVIIRRYMNDDKFYQEQADKASALAEIYMDSETEFVRIIEEYKGRMGED